MTEKVKPENDRKQPVPDDKAGQSVDQTVFRRGNVKSDNDIERTNIRKSTEPTRVQSDQKVHEHTVARRQNLDSTNIHGKNSDNNATRIRTPLHGGQQHNKQARVGDETRISNKSQEINQISSGLGAQKSSQRQVLKGRFTLEKVIGVGGMGVVYKASDRLKVEARDREPYVAIKVLSEEFKSHPESFIALQRESRKTQRIAHPNVVKVYDFDRDGDTVFMTMEYMEGVPLDQLVRQYNTTGLPREEAWSILNGLCSALIHAHAENIVHSDFKPGNIFITDSGVPKIFDFGIARAVANVDRQTGKHKDRTVFDAGSLGALTPAYASLEMLQGQAPDVRDDVYALGCIAYEILTGEHPFNRIPADEAFKSKLKPRKISNIKKRQWKAIEKALQFKREDRVTSVEEFYKLIQPKTRQLSILFSTLVVLAAIGAATYLILSREPMQQKQTAIQVDKIEFKIRYDLFKEKLAKLISDPSFTTEWEDSVWEEISGLSTLLKGRTDPLLSSSRQQLYALYIQQYRTVINKADYSRAQILLKNAYRYTDDTTLLDLETKKLTELIQQQTQREKALAVERQQKHDLHESKIKKLTNNNYLFDLALKNVNQQLECQTKLNMRELGVAIDKLRIVDNARYTKLENSLVVALAECITHVGKIQPERAMEDKNYALRIFKNNSLIEAINIAPRDACNLSIAGLGARGERAICRDKIIGYNSDGPAMVVVPGNGTIKSFAIGKYEISVKEINTFCRLTSSCKPLTTMEAGLPAVNININTAQEYMRWLSQVTKKKYRLPTRKEWIYASKANNHFADPNRNCALNTRGIEKGGQLVRANTGVQNGWGLVNYLGNAREWVYDKNRNLIAVGGSFEDSMEKCNVESFVRQSGNADEQTGFRVVREVSR